MTHLVRAWRISPTIRLFVLAALLVSGTQLVLSRESRVPQRGTHQTKVIGKERLVSVQPLPEMEGEMCVYPEDASPELIASLQPELRRQSSASALMASLPRQQQRGDATQLASTPPRPSDATRVAVATRRPVSTVKDPRN